MDKQIEEMENELSNIQTYSYMEIYPCRQLQSNKIVAEHLIGKGYRKIPENAVVLTREELFRDSTQLSKEKQIEIIHNIILENLDYGYEETATAIYDANYRKIPKLGVILPFDHYDNLLKTDKQVRKETAEKFAERVKMAFYYEFDELIPSIMADKIDEIAREITDKGVQNGN